MDDAEKISVTVSAEMLRAIRASVASGEYASVSEAMRDAVRVWERDRHEHSERMEAIRQRIRTSIADPRPAVSLRTVRERLRSLHDDTVKESGCAAP